MWLTGPVAPRHVGSSQTRARTRVPCIGRQILNHCATREAPRLNILDCRVPVLLLSPPPCPKRVPCFPLAWTLPESRASPGASGLSRHSLALEVLHRVLHAFQLHLLLRALSPQAVQLLPQVVDVGFKHGLKVGPGGFMLLQEAPLGLQDLVLLLQEPHLDGGRRE